MIRIYKDLEQGSPEWFQARLGLLCASEIKLIMTPTLKIASNEKSRSHVFEIMAQRISGYTEPHYISDDMLRGKGDEVLARILYDKHYAPVTEVGFITNDKFGYTIGYSPDGLVGDEGLIEVKSRRQKFQVETIARRDMPDEYMLQVQTALMVTERSYCDFLSYSGGLPMLRIRIYPDLTAQEAIIEAGLDFERKVAEHMASYRATEKFMAADLIPTERSSEMEIVL